MCLQVPVFLPVKILVGTFIWISIKSKMPKHEVVDVDGGIIPDKLDTYHI